MKLKDSPLKNLADGNPTIIPLDFLTQYLRNLIDSEII